MIPTIKTAEGKSAEEEKKHDKAISKEVDAIAKKQMEEAKKTDETLKTEMKKLQPPPLKPAGGGDAASLA